MITKDYEAALIEELKKLLNDYEKRIKENKGSQHQHISMDTTNGVVATGVAIGTAAGTAIPIPLVGNLIGAAAGAGLALGIAGIIEAYHHRKNKKVDNADKVMKFLGHNENERDQLIHKAAHWVIKDRKDMLKQIQDPEKSKKPIAKYLAANMMAAIKHNPDTSHKLSAIREGLKETRSHKVSDHAIEDNNSLSLKNIAQLKR